MFRFTIRELVLLTLLVAMGAGWLVDHMRIAPVANQSAKNAADARRVSMVNLYFMSILDDHVPDWERRFPLDEWSRRTRNDMGSSSRSRVTTLR